MGWEFESRMCATIKTPLARKAAGNHLVKVTFLDRLRAMSLVSATLEIEYGTQKLSGLSV